MAEIRVNATGGLKLYDADDSHYAQIIAGTITSNVDLLTLNSAGITVLDGAIDFDIASHDTSNGLKLGGTLVTATAAELNIMDGVTSTAAEINLIDGGTSRGTTALADGDGILINDAGTMRMTNVTAVKTYMATAALAGIDDQTSSNDDQLTITDSEVTINEDSDDLDFRVESNSYTHAFFVDGGNNRMGSSASGAPDLGFFHIKSADSGADVEAHADELVVEGSGNAGMSILAGNGSASIINFGDDGANNVGMLSYDHGGNYMRMKTNADVSTVVRLNSSGTLSTGNETAADACAGGLTLDQNALDTSIMTFKSSDVAHGMTDMAETDTYGTISKSLAAEGGLRVRGLSDASGASGLELIGDMGGASNTGEATGSNGTIHIDGAIKETSGSATGRVAMGADENTICFRNAGTTEVIFKGDGEIFSNQSATVGTFDAYEDAQLVRAYDLSHMKGVIDSKFDKFVQYNQKDLLDARLIGKDEDGNPTSFVNLTGMSRLHNGAIWQQYEKHERLLEAVYDLAKEAVGEDKANAILDKHEVKRLQ